MENNVNGISSKYPVPAQWDKCPPIISLLKKLENNNSIFSKKDT